jgi:hypothetical protein
MSNMVGETIGNYKIPAEIGAGSMSVVYKARVPTYIFVPGSSKTPFTFQRIICLA